jgi:hypothetical protein
MEKNCGIDVHCSDDLSYTNYIFIFK